MKKYQKGSIGVLLVGGVLLSLLLVVVFAYINAASTANSFEQSLIASKESSENSLAQYGQKVLEATQVTDMARDDIVSVVQAAIQGRYGDNGSRAVFSAIQERNPGVDPGLYRNIQQIVEAGRTEFKSSQDRVIEVKRAYRTALGSPITGMFMHAAGYPRINFDDFKIVTTDRADNAFKSGKEAAPIQLRPQPTPAAK